MKLSDLLVSDVIASDLAFTSEEITVSSTETNNLPNLVVEDATSPTQGVLGGTFEVSWTVSNNTDIDAIASWYDYVYLSDDEIYDGTDTYITRQWTGNNTPLPAGDNYTLTSNITLPGNIQTGSQYLLFIADRNNSQGETDETDNIRAVAIELLAPNLTTSFTLDTLPSAALGETIQVEYTVNNNTDLEASVDWYDYFYLSDDDTFDSSDIYIGRRNASNNTPLAAQGSYTATADITIPATTTTGNRYILVKTDANNRQGETDETDNFSATAIEIEAPNLVASDTLSVPGTVALGETIQVEYTVNNNADVEALGNWYDYFYLSDDDTLDNSDTYIGGRYTGSDTPLAAQSSYTATTDLTIPSRTATGNRYLLLKTDGSNNQGETDETDNVSATAIEIGVSNLVISDTLNAPASAALGETIQVEYTVNNNTDLQASGNWYDYFYLSDDDILDSSDIYIGRRFTGSDTPLAAQSSYTATANITIPGTTATGNYYLLAQTDGNKRQRETDETDNVSATAIEIGATNLVVSDAAVPTQVILSQNFEVSWTVTNNGDIQAPTDWYDYVFLSDNETFGSTDTSLTSQWTGNNTPLAAGDSYTATSNINLGANVATGSYYLLFVADYFDYQGETDETDNIRAVSITVDAPNLVVEDATAPTQAAVGETVEVSRTVKNNGDVEAPTNWYDYIYLSDDEIYDGTDTYITRQWTGNNTPLSAGDDYTVTNNITLPNQAQTGSQYLLFVADRDNYQGETDETDNTRAVSIELSAPNLAIKDYIAPNFASIGQSLELSWTVENQGDVTAFANWYDYVYLSEDATFDNSDTYLTQQWTSSNTPLAAGESYSVTTNVNLPFNQQGERYLIFATNALSNYQSETDETDNFLAVPITIDDDGPNLQVTAVTAPDTALFGEDIEVSWTVANSGGATATANWYDYVYISTDETFDGSDTLVTSHWTGNSNDTSLASGENYTATRNFTIPVTQTGNRYLLFVADAGYSRQGETDETDNVYAHPIEIDSSNVDLVVSDISAQLEAVSGNEVEISWTITNQGSDDATGTWDDYLYLSEDAQVGEDQFYGSFSFTGTIAAGESIVRQQTVSLPIDLQGERYIIVETDRNDQILEFGNENNNVTISDQPFSVTTQPLPNLQVESVTAPDTAFSSQETLVEWTVTNTGNAATSAFIWYDHVWLSVDQTFDDSDISLGQVVNPSYLDVGESYSNNLTVTLPQGIDGNYYFLVQTDSSNQVLELENENDNFNFDSPTDVELTPPPDLQVTSVNPPSQAFSGQPMSLSWTVTNEGTGRTLESFWFDEVYMSADEVIDENDYYLGTYSRSGELNAGESYTTNTNINLPIGVSGDFFFLVRTDSSNNVYEQAFEENNASSSNQTTVNLTPPPDLEVEFVDAPAQATASRNLAVNYRITNFGATETPNSFWQDAFYLSTDDQLDTSSDLFLGERSHFGLLNAGEYYENTANFTLSNDISGDYYVFVVSDSGDNVFEVDNANNASFDAETVTISSRPADLVISSFTTPATGEAGKAIQVNWTVSNQGTGDTAVTSWVDRIIASTDETIGNSDDIILSNFTRNSLLDAGDSYNRSQLVEIPFNVVGDYNLFVVTDVGNNVYEATEDNNYSTANPITITRQTPDLQVTGVTADSAIGLTAEELTVNWTVQNLGAGKTNSNFWYDEIYLSTDENWDSNDIYLGNFRRTNALATNEQYDASKTFTVPFNAVDDFYVIVRTDSNNQVLEASLENNNDGVSAEQITFTANPNPDPNQPLINLPPEFSPDLVVNSVDAPTQAISSQSFEVSWTVENQRYNTGDNSWYDAVYLSRDQVFDRGSDIYLGSYFQSNLDSGDSYTATASFDIPRGLSGAYYVFVATDAGNRIYEPDGELNNIAYDANLTQIILPSPADLVAGTITIPENAVPGENATIEYTVENQSTETAIGSWNDSIYISADDQWDVNDELFKQIQVSGPINSGESYSRTVTATLPGVIPGDYNVIVRSDIRNAIPESDESNNKGASDEQTAVDTELLEFGTPDTGTLAQGQAVYYKIEAEAGQTLKIKLDSASDDSFNELFLRYGEMPTRGQFDFTTEAPFASDPEIIIPTSEAGTYYVLAYGDRVVGEAEYSISAEVLPFSLESIGADKVGNAGLVTLEIKGARFTEDTAFELVDNDGNVISSERLLVQDASTAYVTFNLEDQLLGAYDVKATREDGETALLDDALTVETGSGDDVATNIDGPDIVRPERNYLFNVNFGNSGDADLSTPLLLLRSETSTPMGLELDQLTDNGVLQLLGTSGGQLDTLRPGEFEGVPVYYNSSTDLINFNVEAITTDNTEAADWDLISESVRPLDVPEAEWNAFWGEIQPRIGDTWGDYVSLLNELAVEYSQPGEEIRDVRELFGRLYEENPEFLPSSVLSGQLLDSETGEVLSGVELAAYQVVDEQYVLAGTAVSDSEGNFTIAGLESGSYELALANGNFDQNRDGETDLQPPTYIISQDEDVTDINVYVQASTEEVFQFNDSDASLVIDDNGTSHLLWNRNGSIWHASFNGSEWVNPIQITEETAFNLNLKTAKNLINGTESGLIATWEQGKENGADVYYAVGELTENGAIKWSEPLALTNDSINDAGHTVIVTEDGQVLFNYLKTDYDIQDDADIYYDLVDIQKNDLTLANNLSEIGLLSSEITSFSYNHEFGKNKFFGMTLSRSLKGEGQVSLDSGKKEAKASASLEYELGLGGTGLGGNFKGAAKLEGTWNLEYRNCEWNFVQANLDASVGAKIDWKDGLIVMLGAVPVPGAAAASFALRELREFGQTKGFNVDAGIELEIGVELKRFQWTTQPPFPNFLTPEYIGSAYVNFKGGPYLKAESKGGSFSVNLSGSLSGKAEVYPNFKLKEIAGSIKTEMQWGWFGLSQEYQLSHSFDPSSLSLLNQEDQALEIFYNPAGAIGTDNTYGENFIAADIYSDDAPSTTQTADGNIWMSWVKAGEELGDRVAVAQFDGSQWSQEEFIPNSLGFNSDSSIVAVDDQVLVIWSMADASNVNSETTLNQLVDAHDASDIVYSIYTDGVWSEPIPVSVLEGNDKAVESISQENGNVTITWINDNNEQSSLLTSTWDGSSWNKATSITTANILELTESNIGYLGSDLAVFWTQDTNSNPEIEETSLFYSVYDDNWSDPTLFTVDLTPTNPENLSINGAELNTTDSTSFSTSSGFILPDIPEEWCEYPEDDHDDDEDNFIPPEEKNDFDDYNPQPRRPSDPNDILGPDGFGDERWITATQPLDYTIRFENEPTATAPAQEVIITQQLDEDLDWRTFRLDDFGWGDLFFDLPGNRPFHSQRIDLTEDYGFYVDVFASVDVTTGLATWRIIAIDPQTGEAPLDALSGFLPVNNEDGIGEGFVSYSVKAKRTAETGDVIDAEARIIFDTEEPIDTPPIFNTLDAGLPTSTVAALPARITDESGEFTVNWGGKDDEQGSGIASYTVYVSENGGDFNPWLEDTTLTEAAYTGEPGGKYDFYVVAKDNAGNIQEIPAEAQATTRIAGGTANIGDFVWVDTNGNGIQDTEEPGLEQVTVNLYDTGETLVSTTTTNINGFYSFTEIDPGDYFLEFIAPTDYLFTPENQGDDDTTDSDVNQTTGKTPTFTVEGGEDYSNWDAGLYQLGTISGQKFHDIDGNKVKDNNEAGLEGWTIYLDTNQNGELDDGETSTQTDADSNYSFNDLVPATYTVAEIMQPDWQQTFPGNNSVSPESITTSASNAPIYTPSTPITTTNTALTTTATSLINIDDFRNDSRFTNIDGSGFSSVIIDTGIDLDHPFFGADNNGDGIADRIVYQYDFADNDTDASDVDGHGSHVASIIASSDNTYSGIAPATDIIALKIFQDSGSGYFSDLEESLQWVIDNADTYNIANINLSLGDEKNWNTSASYYGIGDELAALAGMGIIVTSAAGNNFAEFDSQQGLAYPAADPNVIAVGAVWEDTDRIADFSQRDENLSDIFAPGIPIEAANADGGVTTKGGTSQAAPYIAGIATLAQQIATQELGRKLTIGEFRYLLETTSVTINDGDDENDNVTNTGLDFSRVDMLALAEGILNLNSTISNPDSVQPDTNSDDTPLFIPDNVSGFVHTVTVNSGETVTDINFGNQQVTQAPELSVNKGLTLNEEGKAVITNQELQVTDADNTASEITYTLTKVPENGILQLNGTQLAVDDTLNQDDIDNELLEYVHNGSETSSDSFSFKVTDGEDGNIDSTDFQINVNPVNDTPTLESAIANQKATEDSDFSFTIPANTFNDVDTGDELTYSATLEDDSALPDWLTFNPETRTFSGTPTNDNVGNLNVKVTATDKAGAKATDTFTLEVEKVNNSPTVANQIADATTKEDELFSFTIPDNTFNDVDVEDELTYSATLEDGSELPDWLTFNPETRTFSGTPTNDNVGNLNIKVTVTDKAGANVTDTFTLEVEKVNNSPTVANQIADATTKEDELFSFTIPDNTFNDVDMGDELTYSATLEDDSALPDWLSFNPKTRTFSGTPTNDNVGNLNIKVTATDKAGTTASDIFNLTVEEAIDNDFDGNNDGTPDKEQPNVVSLKSGSGSTQDIITLFSQPGSTFKNANITDNPAGNDSDNPENQGIEFPLGFFNFQLEGLTAGSATTVNLSLPQDQNYNTFWKYGKTPDRNEDHWYEFLYNGETGAQFFDTNGDGKADQIALHFVDGKRGDSDLIANGVVVDPGTPGVTNTSLRLSKYTTQDIWNIEGDAGAAVAKFSLVNKNSAQVNEVGVFKLDADNKVNGIAAGETGFAQAALEEGEVIFSALADDLLNGVDLNRKLQVSAGERLGLYFIPDGTVDGALNNNNFDNVVFSISEANADSKDYLQVTEENDIYTLNWEQGNDDSFNDLVMNLQLENTPLTTQNLIANYQGEQEGELINLESFTGREVKATFTLHREAAYDNFVGFYKVNDAQGSITDELTGNTFTPGDDGYAELVVKQRIPGVELSVGNNQSVTIEDILNGGSLFAPFIISDANPDNLNDDFSQVYTPYITGNSDKVDHIRLLGDNIFGFEDLAGGGDNDFNDMIVEARFEIV